MYDAVDVSNLPPGAAAYAGYVDGSWPTYGTLKARFPGAHILSITVFGNDAECADVENGDMTISGIYGWFRNQEARKVWKPCIYSSVSGMDRVAATMTANGFARSSYRLWSAHYGAGEHICGPSSCRLMHENADGTQWTDFVLGRSLDQSLLVAGFFGGSAPPPPPPPPPSDWTERMIANLPTLAEGAADSPNHRFVVRVQGLCNALAGSGLTLDGQYGPMTKAAVETVQRDYGIGVDGVCGQQTWGCLVAGSAG